MDDHTLIEQLEDLARALEIEVRYEQLKAEGTLSAGGLCKLRGKYLLIVNSKAPLREKVQALAAAVSRFDLSRHFLRPGLRAFLETFERPGGAAPSE